MFPKIDFSQLNLMDTFGIAILVEVKAFERSPLFNEQPGHCYPEDVADV